MEPTSIAITRRKTSSGTPKRKSSVLASTANNKTSNALLAGLDNGPLSAALFPNMTKEETDTMLLYKTLRRFPHVPPSQRRSFLLSLLKECDPYDMIYLNTVLPQLHRDFFALLPKKVAFRILGYIHPKDLCVIAGVSKKWKNLLQDSDLWQQLYTNMGLQSMCDSYYNPESPMRVNARKLHALGNWVNGVFRFQSIKAHSAGILGIAFKDRVVVTASADRTAKVWDVRTGACTKTLIGHEQSVSCVVYDENKIITGSTDCTIRIWSPTTGSCFGTIQAHTGTVSCLKLLNPLTLVSGSADKTVKVYQITKKVFDKSSSPRGSMKPASNQPISNVLTPATNLSANFNGNRDNKAQSPNQQTQTHTYEVQVLRTLRGHHAAVKAIDCTNEIILSADVHGEVKVWHVHSGNCLTTIIPPSTGSAPEPIFSIEYSRTRLVLGTVSGHIYLYAVNPYDQYITSNYTAVQYENLRDWANRKFTWTLVRKYDLREKARETQKNATDNTRPTVVVQGVKRDDSSNIKLEALSKRRGTNSEIPTTKKVGFNVPQTPAESTVTLATETTGTSPWTNNPATEAETVYVSKKTVERGLNSVWALSVAMDDWRLMTGSSEGCVKIWNHRTSKHIYTLENNVVESIGGTRALSFDSFKLPGEDEEDVGDDQELTRIDKEIDTSRAITSVKFDDTYIIAACMDGHVKIWEALY